MRIDPLRLRNKSKLIVDYRNNDPNIMDHFDYSPFDNYKQRLLDLKDREFDRGNLVKVLHKINEEWGASTPITDNISRLTNEHSVVVIGGQQAGLATGPMYTINKIISIIQFAKQQEKELNIPVIPVFWIAGEDHDYEEINHIFMEKNKQLHKHKSAHHISEKRSISNIEIDHIAIKEWIDGIFIQLEEAKHTRAMYEMLTTCMEKSTTYVDFFARFINILFKNEGLVLIDSGNPHVRQLESDYFISLIENQQDISRNVNYALQRVQQKGYSVSLDIGEHDVHLFVLVNGERILLERTEAGLWVGKQNEVEFTTKELVQIARNNPELLSNNVVSRPIMQELLFPTLAFVAGDGEIAYWSVLKEAFHVLQLKVPPVLPRLSFTYINRKTEKKLKELQIDAVDAINNGVEKNKMNWLVAQQNPPIHLMTEQIKESIDHIHQPLRHVAKEMGADVGEVAEANLAHILKRVEQLESRLTKEVKEKYEKGLIDFDHLQNTLQPLGGLQERIWNPLVLINEHGYQFISDLTQEQCLFENEHFIVYL